MSAGFQIEIARATTESLILTTERVDDNPVLLVQLERMSVQALLDEHFPTDGNLVGLSLRWVSVVWSTPILSEGDHRLNHVAVMLPSCQAVVN